MRSKTLLVLAAIVGLATCPLHAAQDTLTNDSVVKLVKAGLSDDLIVSTVNTQPGAYDTSADAIIALKSAGASDKVLAAVLHKSSALTAQDATAETAQAAASASSAKPRVFLTAASKGTNQNADRDQSMEMAKDLERNCPDVMVSISQQNADYTIELNHIEVGWIRDNQVQVANKDGDLISKTKEGGSIAGGMKHACNLIVADWSKK
jgi:hypothetical protein